MEGDICLFPELLIKDGGNYHEQERQIDHDKECKQIETDKLDEALSQLRVLSDGKPKAGTSNNRTDQERQQINTARSAAETAILEAERFKAQVLPPNKGTYPDTSMGGLYRKDIRFNNNDHNKFEMEQIRQMRYLDCEDDEFFHTTCHIDEAIKEKIRKGQFVELEKLLLKKLQVNTQENRMQLVNKDGMSYFVPSIDRENKIDNIKKWEQAFRTYTTIYCEANPSRSGEILQYVDIIHRAAAIFNWDNVARYDYVFRQLMASKPHRSWAKVYNQMWNLTLNEPIKKFNEAGNFKKDNYQTNSGQKKKDSFCWKYNKNNCTYGKDCKFDHRCSYCGISGHPVTKCHKKQGKKQHSSDKNKNNTS